MLLIDKHRLAAADPEQSRARLAAQYQMAFRENAFYRSFVRFFPFSSEEQRSTGTLAGLSFAVKDIIEIEGQPLGLGLSDPPLAAARTTASIASALLEKGAALFGATELDALCLDHRGIGSQGKVMNPLAADYSPLGSSCGSAVAVARGHVDFALGSDFGGSVRLPAAACGICGFRPVRGFVPAGGSFLLSETLDSLGYLTKSLEDLQFLFRAVHGLDAVSSDVRTVLIPDEDELSLLPREARISFDHCVKSIGAKLELRTIPRAISFELALDARKTIAIEEAARRIERLGRPWSQLPDSARALHASDKTASVGARAAARCAQQEIAAAVWEALVPGTVILTPTLATPPPRWLEAQARPEPDSRPLNHFLTLANLCGLPALSFPLADEQKPIPFSLQLIGSPGQEMALVSAALQLSRLFIAT